MCLLTLSKSFVGTPVNTSLMDLDQQLEFLGIEKAGSLLRKLKKSTFRHIGDQHANYGIGGRRNRGVESEMRRLGNFTFLMRAVMMRHSQNQTYRDTPTTLMSLPPKVNCCCCCCCCFCEMLSTIITRRLLNSHSALPFDYYLFVHRHTVPSLLTFLQPIEPNTILLRQLHVPTTRP
jgi:hypothetical protein